MKKAYMSEFLGTFILVLIGLGAAALNAELSAIGLANGLILMALVYVFGTSSGAHVNPAVSLGMYLTKRLSFKDFLFYLLFQVLGGLLAGVLLVGFVSTQGVASTANFIKSSFGGSEPAIQVLLALSVEMIATFIFVLVILRVTKDDSLNKLQGIIIGLTLATLIYFAGPLTNASLNPVRSLSPALVTFSHLDELWMFILGPLLGSFLASIVASTLDKK